MFKRLAGAFFLVGLCAATAHADLRYTTQVETRAIPTQGTPSPLVGLVGQMMLMRLPTGTSTTIVGEGGIRVEMTNESSLFPAGSVLLISGGMIAVLNPAEQTYWTVSPAAANLGLAVNPDIRFTRTNETATLAGTRATKSTFEMTLDLPIPAGVQLPPDIPRSLTLDGETWTTDQYREYAALLAKAGNAAVSSLGIGALPQDGFVVKQITRNATLGYEIELSVSDIQEVPPDATLFAIPAGFTQVAMPSPNAPR